jgi:benzoate membrane transport protein
VLTWALLTRFARQWAVPGALLAAVAAIAVRGVHLTGVSVAPAAVFTVPTFSLPALVSIAVPLFLVTMAAQNVPGMAVMATYGYSPPLRGVLVTTGLASAVAAPFGGHALNLAAITAALTAGPDTHPDPRRRWVATAALGAGQLALGLGAGLAMALVLLSPPVLVVAVAGLALLSALGASLAAAVTEPAGREAAVVTFVVTASGTTILNIGSAFWGLVAGGLTALLLHRRTAPPAGSPTAPAGSPASPAASPGLPAGSPASRAAGSAASAATPDPASAASSASTSAASAEAFADPRSAAVASPASPSPSESPSARAGVSGAAATRPGGGSPR